MLCSFPYLLGILTSPGRLQVEENLMVPVSYTEIYMVRCYVLVGPADPFAGSEAVLGA